MADLSRYPDSNGDTGDDARVGLGRGSTTSTPRWMKVFGLLLTELSMRGDRQR